MAELVNLRRRRKRMARDVAEARAEGNRVACGLPKPVISAARRESERAAAALDGHRLAAATPDAERSTKPDTRA